MICGFSIYQYSSEIKYKKSLQQKTQPTLLAYKGRALQTHCKGEDFACFFTPNIYRLVFLNTFIMINLASHLKNTFFGFV